MPLTKWNCVLSYKWKNFCNENGLALPRNYSSQNFQVAFVSLPTVLTGSKCDFQGANLLLLISNPAHYYTRQSCQNKNK